MIAQQRARHARHHEDDDVAMPGRGDAGGHQHGATGKGQSGGVDEARQEHHGQQMFVEPAQERARRVHDSSAYTGGPMAPLLG